jgi:uncharacterized membrane protein YfcA
VTGWRYTVLQSFVGLAIFVIALPICFALSVYLMQFVPGREEWVLLFPVLPFILVGMYLTHRITKRLGQRWGGTGQ